MSLPSQSSRNTSRSSQVYYRRSRRSPLGRLFGGVFLLGVVFALWYFLIRPSASTPPQPPQDTPEDLTAIAAGTGASPDPSLNQPQPPRPLPGSTPTPDPREEVDRVLGTDTERDEHDDEPVTIANHAPTSINTPASPADTDILDTASRQATTPPAEPTLPSHPVAPEPDAVPRGVQLQLDTARRLIARNDRVGARALLSRTLINATLSDSERQLLRDELTVINERLVFSPTVEANDPMCETYTVQSGDTLSKIANRRELATHWKFIARVNQISNPSKIRLGQKLKLVRGPFHAIVDKSDHRIDIYHGPPADPASWLYIRSFDVGLGADDGTPVGQFVVSANKLENPGWVNPRNARERYEPDDPDNPIGEYWIGLTGLGESSAYTSYGIHGTIDPESIGRDESMGCVRLADGDIDIVYEMLAEHVSRVLIVP